ncbi:MAG: hypothetical protein HY820_06830 [Acidobacteria bacterium]|nr:hypothetical protein [Acidobacteriota bacterium]
MRTPAEEQLMAYLDGELSPEARADMECRLAASWELRARLAELQRDVEFYVRETVFQPAVLPPEDVVWRQLQQRVRSMPVTSTPAPPGWRRVVTIGGIAAAVAAVLLLQLPNRPAATADELLERARRAESVESDAVLRPVVHRRLRVRHTSAGRQAAQSVVWDVWRASRPERMRHHTSNGSAPLVEQLRAVFARSGMDPDRPLSAAVFSQWCRLRQTAGAQVRRTSLQDGREGVVVRAQPAPGGGDSVVSSALTLRTADWRPVAQELTVKTNAGTERYEIDEMEYHLLSYDSMPPDFFQHPPATASAPAVEAVVLPQPTVLEPAPSLPEPQPADPADLLRTALVAHLSAHRAGLCTGTPRPGGLSRAIVERLRLPEAQTISLASLLEAIAGDAGALRRHIDGYSALEITAASAELRAQFRRILEEHLAALRSNLKQAAALLVVTDAQPVSAGPPSDWHGAVLALTLEIEQLASLPPEQVAARLLHLSRQAEGASALVADGFSR